MLTRGILVGAIGGIALFAAACGDNRIDESVKLEAAEEDPSPPAKPVDAACPDAEASPGTACEGTLACQWGEESCCGETHPSFLCECFDGTWACLYTDACAFQECDREPVPKGDEH